MKVKFDKDGIMKMALFEKITNAEVMDCISDDERIIFIVKEGDIGAAIGKGGENVRNATEKFGKRIDVVEYSTDLKQFVRNLLAPLKLDDVWVKKYNDDLVVYVRVHPKLRKSIVGDRGKNINRTVDIIKRLTDATNIKVISDSRPPKKFNSNKPKTDKPAEKQSTDKPAEKQSNEPKEIIEKTE
ncbi:NusA-like transcription termination signal-binding factor [Methanococcus aeolicus]|jgi:N utilization substance protein A|uniref:Probable transcription termination protein NusA n=1 Tax=Methanococcus aeolicus (strain ATCC BAA-1280 / DSM 17508 / OCM 812 / Nankai-3) TaxID=419665 RepID=A6UV47_META3|nr:NusA-like transcription termination signal-binding factor [Methanococcus aeolicus]ABR56369.1 NusA family KH domain protein [Methanococcus aeolicus Nankai-3]UXM84370.1 NusA-like transcription termination signal-binding factor [Methanococcus aeolicus]